MAHKSVTDSELESLAPGALVQEGRFRVEADGMGKILVPSEMLWGAQTQRALQHFAIGSELMPRSLCRSYGVLKKAAAFVNIETSLLPKEIGDLIIIAADEVCSGKLDDHFPLLVWQAGSGTPTNMNVNEVISNRAIQIAGGVVGSKSPVHPNDHVNMSQSTNDTFVSAMHIATVIEFADRLIPSVESLTKAISQKAAEWADIVKIGRTHLQDATPLTVGQEWSGYAGQLSDALDGVKNSMERLYMLAAGGTAVGTGLNAPPDFGSMVAAKVAAGTGHPFVTAPNKFAAQASLDTMVAASAALRGLAVALWKIANDIRWLGSGPRCGIHELNLPANEPGSSIMPGKVNPTQEEAMIMVCIQVIGNDTAVAIAGSQGNFELNAMRPVVARNVFHSTEILADACDMLRRFSIEGITLDRGRIDRYVSDSLMLVTALSPIIGYDAAASIAHKALQGNLTLREAAVSSDLISGEEFDRIVDSCAMTGRSPKT